MSEQTRYCVLGDASNETDSFQAHLPSWIVERQKIAEVDVGFGLRKTSLYETRSDAEEVMAIFKKTHGGKFSVLEVKN